MSVVHDPTFFMTPGDRLVGNHQVRQGGQVERPFGGGRGAVCARKPANTRADPPAASGQSGWLLVSAPTNRLIGDSARKARGQICGLCGLVAHKILCHVPLDMKMDVQKYNASI